jgi:hypothetical protein
LRSERGAAYAASPIRAKLKVENTSAEQTIILEYLPLTLKLM